MSMRRILTALCVLAAVTASAGADQRDSRLPALFDKLKSAESVEAAQPVEAEIWTIWAQSDNDDVNLLMGLGVNAMAREDYGTALELFDKKASEELTLIGLHNALRYLGEITGETTTEDMLARIFATFCIGK